MTKKNQSNQLHILSKALTLAQRIMPSIIFETNEHKNNFKNMLGIVRPILLKHGLNVFEEIIDATFPTSISITLKHLHSGQFLQSKAYLYNELEEDQFAVRCSIYSMLVGFVPSKTNLGLSAFNATIPTYKSVSYTDTKLHSECKRCFFLKHNHKLKRLDDGDEKFAIYKDIDKFLKKRFDRYRNKKYDPLKIPPLLKKLGIEAIPYDHKDLSSWRNPNYGAGGIRCFDTLNNLEPWGAVDDVWIDAQGQLILIDYKTTSAPSGINPEHIRQVSFYAFLLKEKGLPMSNIGYILYMRLIPSLAFVEDLQPVKIDFSWIDQKLKAISSCLNQEEIPATERNCKPCRYYIKRQAISSNE